MPLYHYTTVSHLVSILEDRQLDPSKTVTLKKERPVVWLTTKPDWEKTANKMVGGSDGTVRRGTKQDTHVLGGGLIRIEVKPEGPLYTWKQWKKRSGVSKRYVKPLEDIAKDEGANPAKEWRVSFVPIPIDQWIAVDVWDWDKGVWINFHKACCELDAVQTGTF